MYHLARPSPSLINPLSDLLISIKIQMENAQYDLTPRERQGREINGIKILEV